MVDDEVRSMIELMARPCRAKVAAYDRSKQSKSTPSTSVSVNGAQESSARNGFMREISSKAEYDDLVLNRRSGRLVVVDFTASRLPSSRQIGDIVSGIERDVVYFMMRICSPVNPVHELQ